MRKEYRKLLTNTGLLAIGSFASSLLGMLLVPFYTSVLSTGDYGISDLIVTTTSLLYPFATIAISEAIMRFALDKGADRRSIYTIGTTVALIGFVLILCATPIIRNTTIGQYTGFFLAYYLCYCLHTITSYFVKGLEEIHIYSLAGLINSAIVIVCNLVFLLGFNLGIAGYLLSSIVGHAVTMLYMFFAAKLYKYLIKPWNADKKLLGNMIRYSAPIIPNSISWWVANSADKYMLNYYADTSQVGIYSISYKIPTIMMTVMGFFISAWQLSAVDDFGSEKSKRFFSEVYNKCIAVNVLLAAGLTAFSKLLGQFLYSADFFEAWKYVPVLILANVFNVLASFMGTVYTAAKKTKMLSLSTIIGAISNIVMNFILIPVIGAMGAAIATAGSYFIMWIVRMINTRCILAFSVDVKRDVVILTALLAQVVLVSVDTMICHILAYIVFALLLVFFRKLVMDVIKQVLNGVKNKLRAKKI